MWTLETHACDAEELAFSADGARLFARCGLGLRIADVAEGRWTHYPDVGGSEPGLAVSPGGDLVAAGRWVWEVEQLRMTPPAHHAGPLPGHAAAWSPDGALIACVGHDGAVRLATLSGVVTRVLTPPRAPGDPAQQDWLWWHDPLVRFSPDGSRLAARMPGGVRVWEATTGTLLLELRDVEPVADLRFSRDGSTLATVAQGRLVHWLVPGGIELAALPLLAASSSPWHSYGSFAISPDLRSVSCSRGSGRLPNPLETKSLDGTHRWRWTGLYTRALAYSPDGQFVAACGANTLVQLWRAD